MIRWFKPAVFLACLIPLALLGWKAYNHALGANPIEVITHATGDWILRFLLITLAVTPIRKLTGQLWLIRYRRMFGLFAFFYATLHFLTYIWLDKFFDLHEMLHDIAKRKFITVDQGMDPASRRETLASPASPDLFQRDRRSNSLLVAGKGRHPPAAGVRCCSDAAARIPHRSLGRPEGGHAQRKISQRIPCGSPRAIVQNKVQCLSHSCAVLGSGKVVCVIKGLDNKQPASSGRKLHFTGAPGPALFETWDHFPIDPIRTAHLRLGHGPHSYKDRSPAATSWRARSGSSRDFAQRPRSDPNSHSCHGVPSAENRIASRKRPAVSLSIIEFKRSISPSAVSSHASHPHVGKADVHQRPKRTAIPGKVENTTTMGAAPASLGTRLTLGRATVMPCSSSGSRPYPSARSASNSRSNRSSNSAATRCRDANRSGSVTRE
jgi:hypothetical protein